MSSSLHPVSRAKLILALEDVKLNLGHKIDDVQREMRQDGFPTARANAAEELVFWEKLWEDVTKAQNKL